MATESFNTLIQELTQDISAQVHQQVQGTVTQMVRDQVEQMITPDMIQSLIASRVNQIIDQYVPDLSEFERKIAMTSDSIAGGLAPQAQQILENTLAGEIGKIDIAERVQQYIVRTMTGNPEINLFPDDCIPGRSIQVDSLRITGDNIQGGVIARFASTGLDDQASGCQMTIMDQGTVFENTLYAPAMEVRGDLTVDGALVIRGGMESNTDAFRSIVAQTAAAVADSIGPELLDRHQDRVFELIRTQGVELGQLSINGQEIFAGRTMTAAIVNSHLETVGVLRDLQTQGETLLCETLYTTQRRVGINTMDPATALTIWDEDVEIGIGKQQKDTARIAMPRRQRMVLGSNGNDNLAVLPDGSVQINTLRIGNVSITSGSSPPSHTAAPGHIVINENPTLGGPMGWISLGDARWANFGIID